MAGYPAAVHRITRAREVVVFPVGFPCLADRSESLRYSDYRANAPQSTCREARLDAPISSTSIEEARSQGESISQGEARSPRPQTRPSLFPLTQKRVKSENKPCSQPEAMPPKTDTGILQTDYMTICLILQTYRLSLLGLGPAFEI